MPLSPISSSNSRVAGFTLLELLSVITITTVLAALLYSATRSSLGKAQQIQCASNLHTIGQAFSLFTSDNNGEYPRASTPDDNGNANWQYEGGFWFNALGPYLDEGYRFKQELVSTGPHPQRIPFACPTVPAGQHGWGGAGIDIAINSFILPSTAYSTPRVRVFNVKNPTSTFLVADSAAWLISIPEGANPPIPAFQFRHGGAANVLFFDGHVGQVTRKALQANPAEIAKLRGDK
jgi:prepilin-type processing-associated H-X9-DG protein/prepilin-type N-terminal cleavage/methylation domain-containing protein